jgi:hypothetical protein
MPITLPDTTLTAIQTKVRRLTKSPSEQLLSTDDINDYVNTFILYDFPEHLRLFALRQSFSFYTSPNIDTYSTVTAPNTSPLYNFNNLYITVHDPVYVAGFKALFTQSREQFYNIYPFINSEQMITTGDGTITNFTGVIPGGGVPFLQNNVLFCSIDVNNNGLSMTDYPISSAIGNLRVPNAMPTSTTMQDPNNFVNYLTGQFSVTFPTAPGNTQNVNVQIVPYVPQRPMAMLYFDDEFVLRPVPDQPYQVNFEVYARPTALLSSGQSPQLAQWWQYIAYGAAKKILEDRVDIDSVALLLPEYKKQELLVLRTTIVQNTNERTATIYTEQTESFGGPWGWNNNNN